MLVSRAKIHKMLVRVASREDPLQTASSESSPILVCTVCLVAVKAVLAGNY